MASLSRIYAFDVKPFHTHWYRWPGNLKHPFSLSVIPNGYNIEETCASCFMERVVHRRFAVHYVIECPLWKKSRHWWWERCPNERCRQKDCNTMMIQNYDYEVQTSYTWYLFFIFSLFFLNYVTNFFKKLDYVNWFILFLIRIKFGHAQIRVPKIGIPMSKIACTNPCMKLDYLN